MIQRPKLGETEKDLLQQQEEFLRASGKKPPPEKKIRVSQPQKQFNMIVDIKEKRPQCFSSTFEFGKKQCKGFPEPFSVELSSVQKEKGKKSLFAMEMEKHKKKVTKDNEIMVDEVEVINRTESSQVQNSHSQTSSDFKNMKKTIHEENLEKLSQISQQEILMEQKKLLDTLDPSLVEFLKNRRKEPKIENAKVDDHQMEIEVESRDREEEEEVKSKLEKFMDSRWINMDFIEKEKLEWIGDLPDKKSLEPGQPYSARFNFKGELQPFIMDVDVRSSLYHHGEEQERPGYTIQELYQLSRSQVLQQRILALNTLSNIMRKTKLGFYDNCFDGQLLHKLVESDLFFLIRFSIDENALVPASVFCLHSLLCNESDEFCLDKLLGVTNRDDQPLIFNELKATKEEEEELKDHVVIAHDLIKGVLRTDLLIRLSYILNKCAPNRETVIRIVKCLIRISRHSIEAAEKILETTGLVKAICGHLKSGKPIWEGVKLFRLMAVHSQRIALELIRRQDVKFLVFFLDAEENAKITRKEFYLLKLETVYFWRTLLSHDLLVGEFDSWSPCLTRLLLFYVEKVDAIEENEFDFELFTALASLMIVCNEKKISYAANAMATMKICLTKWLTQFMQRRSYNFSAAKAVGCLFRYFASHFDSFGIVSSDLEFVRKIDSILRELFRSKAYEEMSSALIEYSHVLNLSETTRDPDNLPSLCSVYEGGENFLKIVQKLSCLPFYVSSVKYLRKTCEILADSKSTANLYLNSFGLRNYLRKVLECKLRGNNWFARYETTFMTDLLDLMILVKDGNSLNLGFRLLPMLRIDDEMAGKVLELIFDRNNWETWENFPGQLFSLYSETLLQRPSAIYKNHLVPEEWTYKILADLREKEEARAVVNVLKFINFVLEKNPKLLERISPAFRYYYSCQVFLRDSYVFDEEIQRESEKIFRDLAGNREKVNLNVALDRKKSFYDLYTELITQYAGVSYGLPIFAKFVLFPLQNGQNSRFRKLIWFEYLHVLRVINLPFPVDDFVELKAFVEPCETDESLLLAYLNSISNGVLTKIRNPFVYKMATGNLKNFLISQNRNEKLAHFITAKINRLESEELKGDILNFSLNTN